MKIVDRREEFNSVAWQQGMLILTPKVRRQPIRWQEETAFEEKCSIYAFFSLSDEGRSRKFLFKFKDPASARAAVLAHNKSLKSLEALDDLQRERLLEFITHYGSNWKEVLGTMWWTGRDASECDGHLLRQIRNQLGPVWLDALVI